MSNSQTLIQEIDDTIAVQQRKRAWIVEHAEVIDGLPKATMHGCQIDFDRLKHDEIVRVMMAFKMGRWNKSVNGASEDRVDYVATSDDMTIRCWSGEPPPHCKIVEVDEVVPAQPETTRSVRKLQCA